MQNFRPEQIYENFINKKFTEETALELLIYLIENERNNEIRDLSLRYIYKINSSNKSSFKILENLLLSDSNENIRSLAAYFLIRNYHNTAYEPIKWALTHERSELCLTTIIKSLINTKSNHLKSLIKNIQFVVYNQKVFFPSRSERMLNLNQKNIKKVSQICGLKNLNMIEEIYLQDNELTEIDGLKDLENLKILSLRNNSIKEIKGLDKLFNLKTLYLQNNNINRINGLENLVNLEELYLDQNNIKNIEGLGNLKKLERLVLNNNQIIKIEGLDNLNNLKDLFIRENKIREIEGLDSLVNLKRLDLGNNKIREIKNLNCLVNLEYLYLNDNKVKELMRLKQLTNLKYLSCRNNEINSIENLESLINLEFLYLQNNYISNISPLINLKNLKILDLSTNEIMEIPNWLYSYPCLKELNLINCPILDDGIGYKELKKSSNRKLEIIMESDKENRYREPIYKEIIDVEYVSKIDPLELLNMLNNSALRKNTIEIFSNSTWKIIRYDNTCEYFKLNRDGTYTIV